jgi:type IV pilus assembly protein PilN
MIKINLVPKQRRERQGINLDVIVLIATIVIAVGVVGGLFIKNSHEIERFHSDTESLKQQARALAAIEKEFLSLEKDKKDLTKKLAAIDKIREGRALTPRMLYDLSSLVKENLWLKRIRKDERSLEIEGRSADSESICDFVERLSKLPYLKDLELKSVEDVSEGGIAVKRFIISGSVTA